MDELLRLDLVVVSPDSAPIVDVTVRFEQGGLFIGQGCAGVDCKVFQAFLVIQRRFSVPVVRVIPVVIGARGRTLPSATVTGLAELGIADFLDLKSLLWTLLGPP